MSALASSPELQLPWESSGEEDARYRMILRYALLALIAVSLLLPILPVEKQSRERLVAVPPQLARVILEKKLLPKPVPAKPKPKPVKKMKARPLATPIKKAETKPRDRVEQARKVAAVSGLLAFADDLTDMRDSIDVASLNRNGLSQGQAQAAKTERAIISSALTTSSGGIKSTGRSHDMGGPALSAHKSTRVESTIAIAEQAESNTGSTLMGGRSDASIRRVMDKNKGGIFAIYNRALRKNPTLQGKLVFEMVIEASGAISELKLLSTELSDAILSQKILARIRMIQFGEADVIATRVNYSFDFLPY
jgi:hypothetical protein